MFLKADNLISIEIKM